MPKLLMTLALALLVLAQTAEGQPPALEAWTRRLEQLVPLRVADCTPGRQAELAQAASAVEEWAVRIGQFAPGADAAAVIAQIDRLAATQSAVDVAFSTLLDLRSAFVADAAEPAGTSAPANASSQESWPAVDRAALAVYLRMCAILTELSGKLRYQMRDATDAAAYRVAARNDLRERLLDVILQHKSDVGADVMAAALFDPPPRPENRAQPATPAVKAKIIACIAASGRHSLTYDLAEYLREGQPTPELAIAAAEAIRELGLPQDPRPESAQEDLPAPAITAAELHTLLSRLPAARLPSPLAARRDALLAWLAARREAGLQEDVYRLGAFDVRPGDWLLMRNPSPYNLFTDLSPGLFTHVGIVAVETGSDGRRRMVLVDLPERGSKIPATNVEIYVQRSLHYAFLRHPEPGVAARMAQAAESIIGNESVFDLNFRTDRILPLKGQPLRGQKVHTFCTGLLLLCAQQTPVPRHRLFPIVEGAASPQMAENFKKLGVSLGSDFVSPTSALFSPELQIAGRVPPYYDPGREIEEGIFDHFAMRMREHTLELSLDTFQALRLKLAEASRNNPALAQALAAAGNVSAQMDLVAAARTAAVVETLDEIAFGGSRAFRDAWFALTCGPLEELPAQGYTSQQVQRYRQLRQRESELFQQLETRRLSPREARIALVKRFIEQGRRDVDRRFFTK